MPFSDEEEEKPKKRRGRPPKATTMSSSKYVLAIYDGNIFTHYSIGLLRPKRKRRKMTSDQHSTSRKTRLKNRSRPKPRVVLLRDLETMMEKTTKARARARGAEVRKMKRARRRTQVAELSDELDELSPILYSNS